MPDYPILTTASGFFDESDETVSVRDSLQAGVFRVADAAFLIDHAECAVHDSAVWALGHVVNHLAVVVGGEAVELEVLKRLDASEQNDTLSHCRLIGSLAGSRLALFLFSGCQTGFVGGLSCGLSCGAACGGASFAGGLLFGGEGSLCHIFDI